MVTVEFKTQACALRLKVGAPSPTVEAFREVLSFLDQMRGRSADLDYRDLLTAFSNGLRSMVNRYRHRRILEREYRDPGQLRQIKVWLELWVNALFTLECTPMNVPEWHATYDTALSQGLSALIRMRRGQIAQASEAWTEAATICMQWLSQNQNQRTTRGYGRLEADYHYFEARALRCRGQHTLSRQRPMAQEFDEAGTCFENGVSHMQESVNIQTRFEGSAAVQELNQLEYLAVVSRYRSAVLRRDIPVARGFLDQLAKLVPKARFQRGYFGDSAEAQTEVRIEGDFLDAFHSVLLGDLPEARVAANRILAGLPAETPETARHMSLRLRALATRFLAADPDAHNDLAAIDPTDIGFDPANRYLLGLNKRLAASALSVESAVDHVLAVFPLDALPPESASEEASGPHALDWLPPFYLDWLDQLSDSPEGIGRIRFLQWQYVANIAEYLCRLHLMKKSRGDLGSASPMPPDFRLLGFRELREVLISVGAALDWSGTDLPTLIDWVDRCATSQGELGDPSRLARDFAHCVAETSRLLYPHVVQVKEQTRLEAGEVTIRLERVWRLPQRELLLVCLGAKGLLDGEYYFLKARFKEQPAARFSERLEIVNVYRATTFALPAKSPKRCVLVEGDHDEYAFRRLFDRFLPYWEAQVELRGGGGSALPCAYERAVQDGYRVVVVVADADKKGSKWDNLSPIWLTPDFEGVDLDALAEAMHGLWGDSIGSVTPDRLKEIIERDDLAGGTINKLRTYFQASKRTFLPDENQMKKELRSQLSGIWLRTGRLPAQISDVLTTVAERAFGLAPP